MFLPPLVPIPLATTLLNQIDFYFSDANLLTDEYLKKNMDAEGWVPISLIASFRRVQMLTNNIELILNSLRASNVVEVQGDKVRRRNDWMRWVRLPSSEEPISSSPTLETKVTAAAALDKSKSVPEST
jgi:la-related protein 1